MNVISSFNGEDSEGWFSSSLATDVTELAVLKETELYFGTKWQMKGADPVDPSAAFVNPLGYGGAANVVSDDKM
ncbi:hypothetical protein ACFX2C_027973 [Malus domestica]